MKIVFVCTGNTCRSPMAQGLFHKILTDLDMPAHHFQVSSAGLHALKNQPVSAEAVAAMQDYKIDISQHRTAPLEKLQVEEADLLLTMTHWQADYIKEFFPSKKDRTFSLSEYVGYDNMNIEDPYGAELITYKKCAADLNRLLMEAMVKIIELIET